MGWLNFYLRRIFKWKKKFIALIAELKIDGAGKDDDYAEELLDIANNDGEYIYIKSDGSLDDGMELVSHLMTLDYHKDYCWSDIMRKAVSLGYRSHQTSTCGLHIHINRTAFSDNREEQDEVISRILYFMGRSFFYQKRVPKNPFLTFGTFQKCKNFLKQIGGILWITELSATLVFQVKNSMRTDRLRLLQISVSVRIILSLTNAQARILNVKAISI